MMTAVDVGIMLEEMIVETILAVGGNIIVSSIVNESIGGDIDNGALMETVKLIDGITGEVVSKMVEDGVMITLDSTTTATEGKIVQCVIPNYSQMRPNTW